MMRNLNLTKQLLRKGRTLHRLGLHQKALSLFQSLANFRNLPSQFIQETHVRLTQLHHHKHKYQRARRHLSVALAWDPSNAAYHFRLGQLAARDTSCDPAKTRKHFRRALRLDPGNPVYLSAFGMYLLREGEDQLALKYARRAFRIAPDNAMVVKRLLKVLQTLDRVKEAKRTLKHCRFRLGKMEWFQELYSDFRFNEVRKKQHAQRRPVPLMIDGSACLLPFPKVEPRRAAAANAEYTRDDRPTVLRGPHLPLRLHRHAQ